LSQKTIKELKYHTKDLIPIKTINSDINELWYILGKKAGIISINDEGFSKKIIEHI